MVVSAACGSGPTKSTSTAASATPTPSATAVPTAVPTETPSVAPAFATGDITPVMLTAAEVAAAAGAKPGAGLHVVSDGQISGVAYTDKRDYEDSGHLVFFEIQMYHYASPAAATADYSRLVLSFKSGFTRITQTLKPKIGTAIGAEEWIGTLQGDTGIAVTFQEGAWLCGEYALSNVGFVTNAMGPGVATAQAAKIASVGGG